MDYDTPLVQEMRCCVYQMDYNMPLVQETYFWCTNQTKYSGELNESVGYNS